jgi:hypothetical protein
VLIVRQENKPYILISLTADLNVEIQFPSRAKPCDIFKDIVSMQQVFIGIDLCQYHSKRLYTHFYFGTNLFRKIRGRRLGTIEKINVLSKNCKAFERKFVFSGLKYRAMAHTVGRRPLTAASRIRVRTISIWGL